MILDYTPIDLKSIDTGKAGYIYLIHAEGTNRYKIGRSVNPIARVGDIQKQSPYPLKIIKSAWTLDTHFDEAKLHQKFARRRVFGEWFNFGDDIEKDNCRYALDYDFEYPPIIDLLKRSTADNLASFLGISNPDQIECSRTIYDFYSFAKERRTLVLVEVFLRETLLQLIVARSNLPLSVIDGQITPSLQEFIAGAVLTFEDIVFNNHGFFGGAA